MGITRRTQIAAGSVAVALTLAGCGGGQAVVQAGAPPPGPSEMYDDAGAVVPVPDEECGLTAAEKDAKYKGLEAAWDQRLAAWIDSEFVRQLDPRTLPQNGILNSPVPGRQTLRSAVRHADAAVLGTVETLVFASYASRVTFRVERAAKGEPGSRPTILGGLIIGPGPRADWEHPTLGVSEAELPLFAGDRAVLLLERVGQGRYRVQSYSGAYRSSGGRVTAMEGNHFRDEVDGLTEDELMDRIAAHAGSGSGGPS